MPESELVVHASLSGKTTGLAIGLLWAASGCLRQATGAGVAEPRRAVSPAAEREEAPIAETDKPTATFLLNGEPFCFAGTNNYYLIYHSQKMTDDVLETAKRLGLKTVRFWGMLDRGSLDGTVRDIDGKGEKNGVYFQYWDTQRKRPAYNDGKNGLERFDYVLDKARQLDLKVIPVLVNNWKDFGGMDQYVVWFGRQYHHQFYTDPVIVGAYKDWVAHLVNRKNSINGIAYRDDPTILAWELANEPRCTNSGEFNGPGCKPQIITDWADSLSTYIKSIDENHLVAVGDEGFFAGGNEAGYNGDEGVDHDGLLALGNIDFGTFHLYPDTWGHRLSWASRWIEDHIEAARKAGKPTLLEEYGIAVRRNATGAIADGERRYEAYPRWHDLVQKRGGNGALIWMLAGVDDEHGRYPDYDSLTVYAEEPTGAMLKAFASRMSTDARACTLYKKAAGHTPSGPKTPFVTVSRPGTQPRAANALSPMPPT